MILQNDKTIKYPMNVSFVRNNIRESLQIRDSRGVEVYCFVGTGDEMLTN